MACDLATLASTDSQDIEQLMQVLDQCTKTLSDPRLWIWAIVITAVCAAVGAMIGKRKNAVVRDAILGAALGPIGWIISLCLPVSKPRPVCQACKREVGPDDVHCRYCGAKLKPSSQG